MLSIIVPVYNAEALLPKAIESVLGQTYRDFELIIVNDGSKGNCGEIVSKYMRRDKRIRYVVNKGNLGLFKARLAGAREATGQYIAFLDSDDYVSMDYYRVLMQCAITNDADIVASRVLWEANGKRHCVTMQDNAYTGRVLNEGQIRERYFGSHGLKYLWHLVWDKIYSRRLWDKCLPFYSRLDCHIVMSEDHAFTTPLMYFAERMAFIETEYHCYVKHDSASTSTAISNYNTVAKKISDITKVFDFIDSFMHDVGADTVIKNNVIRTRESIFRLYWWHVNKNPNIVVSAEDRIRLNQALTGIAPAYYARKVSEDEISHALKDDWCLNYANVDYDGLWLETIKKAIRDNKCEYVSFDVFDTLVIKPFLEQQDLFQFLNRKYAEQANVSTDFAERRIAAESKLRRAACNDKPPLNIITLDAIYDEIASALPCSAETADAVKAEEIRLETHFCRPRKTAKELFELARYLGKKVVIISDTCHDTATIELILKKCGYDGYERLFLSSNREASMASDGLFQFALDTLKVPGNSVCHIGNNWKSDYLAPKERGIRAFIFPSPVDTIRDKAKVTRTNDCASIGKKVYGPLGDTDELDRLFCCRISLALAANRYFDNPFRPFHPESDFNIDPFLIGFYPLAMHQMGLALWIIEQCSRNGFCNARFVGSHSRLTMEFFNKLAPLLQCETTAEYLPCSRSTLLAASLTTSDDFHDLGIDEWTMSKLTPAGVMKLLGFCMKKLPLQEVNALLADGGFPSGREFGTTARYHLFISLFLDKLYDSGRHSETREFLANHLSGKAGKDSVFIEMDGQGIAQAAISAISKDVVNILNLYKSREKVDNHEQNRTTLSDFFYRQIPASALALREFITSDDSALFDGLIMNGGVADTIAPPKSMGMQRDMALVKSMQSAALEFVDAFVEIFGEYIKDIPFRPFEMSMPFEGFLRMAKDMDLRLFSSACDDGARHASANIFAHAKSIAKRNDALYLDTLSKKLQTEQSRDKGITEYMENRGWFVQSMVYLLLDRKRLANYTNKTEPKHPPIPRFLMNMLGKFSGK